ncbi:cyclic di-GMP phosphodiesterase response regulator RpfG [Moorella thermoacetica]|uniref:Cyclic di-GMP phosphodiesterase response regulator RpfG n=1 Tax=Neomoorella thermoacetica TaxID=1525 RepID=A0A1J5NKU0_NEOTH|nr:cyclic di-GMP phosphodiesterase response regulator RpfG [Moorella thermoacetica]
MYLNIINALLVQRDLWTVGVLMREWHEDLFRHSILTADLAVSVARRLGFSDIDVELARLAGFLHDFGKVTWPKELVAKHPLDSEDWQIVKVHPIVGARLAKEKAPNLSLVVLRVVEEHHERDGDGYPRGLQASDLHPLSRVVACVECFVALLEERPYRPCRLTYEQILRQISLNGFDWAVVDALQKAIMSEDIKDKNNFFTCVKDQTPPPGGQGQFSLSGGSDQTPRQPSPQDQPGAFPGGGVTAGTPAS